MRSACWHVQYGHTRLWPVKIWWPWGYLVFKETGMIKCGWKSKPPKSPGAGISHIKSEVNPLGFLEILDIGIFMMRKLYKLKPVRFPELLTTSLQLIIHCIYVWFKVNPGSIWIVNGKTDSDGWCLSKIAYKVILLQIIEKCHKCL